MQLIANWLTNKASSDCLWKKHTRVSSPVHSLVKTFGTTPALDLMLYSLAVYWENWRDVSAPSAPPRQTTPANLAGHTDLKYFGDFVCNRSAARTTVVAMSPRLRDGLAGANLSPTPLPQNAQIFHHQRS
jgi:hypothetical protein